MNPVSSLNTPSLAVDLPRSAERVRVLHVNSGNLYGGVETILVTLARLRHLCPTMESHFALCHDARLCRELVEAGVPVYVVGQVRISRPWTVWRARRRLRGILRKERFDLVICHMPWSLVVFGKAVRAAGQKLGFWAHAFHTGRGWLERWARRVTPDVAIGNSRFTEAALVNLFPGVPHGVIYPPVALTESADAEQQRFAIRRQQAVSEETAVIIQVSRMEACKGHFGLLEALAGLKHVTSPWVCWLVGGPQKPQEEEYLQQLQSRAKDLHLDERVRFLGQRTDVAQLLAAADIYCQPNETPESFGISFVEALWAGVPVITTDLGGAKEIINDSCGLLVEPKNPALVAASLEKLLGGKELRTQLGRSGSARALELCDPGPQMNLLKNLCHARTWKARMA